MGAAALLHDPGVAPRLVAGHGVERIVAALDVRAGIVVGEAWWQGAAGRPALEVLGDLIAAGLRVLAVTAIERDGLLGGPDLALYRGFRSAAPEAPLIASGGVG